MKTSGKSEVELKRSANRKMPTGWQDDAEIEEVTEDVSQAGNEMFKCLCAFVDAGGHKWNLTVYLTDTEKGAWLLRRACQARGVVQKYDAQCVDQSDLPGPVRLKVGIEKRKGWADRLKVEDFAARDSSPVVQLRSAG